MKFMIYEIDYYKGILKTVEGKKFKINPYDISVIVGWCPTDIIKLVKRDGKMYLYYYNEKVLVTNA